MLYFLHRQSVLEHGLMNQQEQSAGHIGEDDRKTAYRRPNQVRSAGLKSFFLHRDAVPLPGRREPIASRPLAEGRGDAPAFCRHPDGSVIVSSFKLASQILRSAGTRQAGFNADMVARFPQKNVSVLFKEGEAHRQQRSAVARFFAPTTVMRRYRPLMTDVSTELVQRLKETGRGDLDVMSLEISVTVAAEIIGLADSVRSGLGRRLNRFFAEIGRDPGWFGWAVFMVRSQINLLAVYLRDVRPAIRKRRASRQDDLISHLLDQGWSDFDILTECVTYGTSGLSTTREFIVLAAWHLLERDDLRQRFLAADEASRNAILDEILRLEPAVGTIYRRTTAPMVLEDEGRREELAAETLIAIDVRGVNADRHVAGACPHRLEPDRGTGRSGIAHMSFGDGPHRCPGSTVALQETSIFLDQLLRVPGLRLADAPTIGWNTTTTGYVLRNASLVIE